MFWGKWHRSNSCASLNSSVNPVRNPFHRHRAILLTDMSWELTKLLSSPVPTIITQDRWHIHALEIWGESSRKTQGEFQKNSVSSGVPQLPLPSLQTAGQPPMGTTGSPYPILLGDQGPASPATTCTHNDPLKAGLERPGLCARAETPAARTF